MSVLVKKLCQQFRQEWSSGRPDLSAFLTSLPDKDRKEVAPHLIEIDVSHRVRAGERPTPDDYRQLLSQEELSGLSDVFSPEAWSRSTGTHAVGKTWIENSISAPPVERTRIGRYEVLGILGEGAFGTVYRAHDSNLSREVAIKVPRLGDKSDQERIACLLKEAEAAASLSHPNIVKVFDFGHLDDGGCFVVFELVPGGNLSTEIRSGPISVERAVDLMIQIADGVHHAHQEKDLFHRDLKPANILLSHSGNPLITDFGLAVSEQSQIDTRGEVSGTLAYMSPEQTRGEAHLLDGRTDIWSLGVILYEMLTGRRPFAGTSPDEIFEQIQTRDPRPLCQISNQIPDAIGRVCLKCLQRAPSSRYSSASELAVQLRAIQNGLNGSGEEALIATKLFIQASNSAPPEKVNLPVTWEKSRLQGRTRLVTCLAALLFAGAAAGFTAFNSTVGTSDDDDQDFSIPKRQKALIDPEQFDAQAVEGRWNQVFEREPVPIVWPSMYRPRWNYDAARQEVTLNSSHPALLGAAATGSESFRFHVSIHRNTQFGSAGIFWGLRDHETAAGAVTANLLTATGLEVEPGQHILQIDVSEVTFFCLAPGKYSSTSSRISSEEVAFPNLDGAKLEFEIQEHSLVHVWWDGNLLPPEFIARVRKRRPPLNHSGPVGLMVTGSTADFSDVRLQVISKEEMNHDE